MFRIVGDPSNEALKDVDMIVTVNGDGQTTVKALPVGTYTVTEIENWSWRYTKTNVDQTMPMNLADSEVDYKVTFTNKLSNPFWLSGDSYVKNSWKTGIATDFAGKPIN